MIDMSCAAAAAAADEGDKVKREGGRPSISAACWCHTSARALLLLMLLLLLLPSFTGKAFMASAITTAMCRSYEGDEDGDDWCSWWKMRTRGERVATAKGFRSANEKHWGAQARGAEKQDYTVRHKMQAHEGKIRMICTHCRRRR
jgi:hypothetical protein